MNQRLLITKLFCILYILLFSLAARAQPVFSIPVVNNAVTGQFLELPVIVESGFDSLVSVQFVILWDPTVLRFEEVNSLNLPDLDLNKFGLTQAVSDGILRFAWWRFVTEGNTVPNGTEMFKIKFKVIGPTNSGTALNFTELPPLTFYEVVHANSTVWNLNQSSPQNGFVAVGYTVSATDPVLGATLQIFPNPARSAFSIETTFLQNGVYSLRLVDASGKTVYTDSGQAPAGPFQKTIPASEVSASGAYWLQLHPPGSSKPITRNIDIID